MRDNCCIAVLLYIDVDGDVEVGCIYLNTSILIGALEDQRARRLLEECCRRYRCMVSSVHWREEWKPETLTLLAKLLEDLAVARVEVDTEALEEKATAILEARGWSPRRLIDLMHVLAALELGCRAVAAIDAS